MHDRCFRLVLGPSFVTAAKHLLALLQITTAEAAEEVLAWFEGIDISPQEDDIPCQFENLLAILQKCGCASSQALIAAVARGAAKAATNYTAAADDEPCEVIAHLLAWIDGCVIKALEAVLPPVVVPPSLPVTPAPAGSLLTPCGAFLWPSTHSSAKLSRSVSVEVCHAVLADSLEPLMASCFDTITQWPDSGRDTQAWAAALKRDPRLRSSLVRSLQKSFRQRLLRAAVPTQTVLDVYSLALSCLMALDPAGIVCDAATEPVQHTLRQRSDTVKCVVTALTAQDEEGGAGGGAPSGAAADRKAALETTPDATRGIAPGVLTQADRDFTQSLQVIVAGGAVSQRKGGCLQAAGGSLSSQTLAEHMLGIVWEPESREVTTGGVKASRSDDLIGTLTALYGTAEMFVAEFRSQLRDRLLALPNFDIESDIGVLELLKMRFGDAALHSAEVMLNDIAESRRALTAVRRECPSAGQVPEDLSGQSTCDETVGDAGLSALLVSEQYWPALKKGLVVVDSNAQVLQPDEDNHAIPVPCPKLHPQLQGKYDAFSSTWEKLKAPRHLRWQHHLGSMTISVAPRGSTTTAQVTTNPLSVSVLLFVNDAEATDGSPVVSIAQRMQLQPSAVLKLAKVWMQQGILEAVGTGDDMVLHVVQLGEEGAFGAAGAAASGAAPEEEDEELSDEARARMAMCEQFVYGMLRNMGSLQLAMIHNNLKMFMSMSDGAGTHDCLWPKPKGVRCSRFRSHSFLRS